jgi:hypothetical protein
MRRAGVLAVILLIGSVAPAQGAARVPIVTGHVSYAYLSHVSTLDVAGRAGDPAAGWFSYGGEFATFAGPVVCVRVDGAEAWLAGPITSGSAGIEGVDAWAVRLHDGGTPGWAGDTAITLVDTLEGVRALCETGSTEADGYLQPVIDGNLTVRSGR